MGEERNVSRKLFDGVRETKLKELKEQHNHLGQLIKLCEDPNELLRLADQARNVQAQIEQTEMGKFRVDIIRP